MNFNEVFVKIDVSSIHMGGVWVIAIRNIPPGQELFKRKTDLKGVCVYENDIPEDIRSHIVSFCPLVEIKRKGITMKRSFIPSDGFN